MSQPLPLPVHEIESGSCQGALDQLLNYFLPTMKLERKERVGSKTVRHYGVTQTPLARVLACAEVTAATKKRLKQERAALNEIGRAHV